MPYVSSPKNAIARTTKSPYRHPIPYAQRQVARATRNPKTNAEIEGDTMKPMVQMFSYHNWLIVNFSFASELLDVLFGLGDEKDTNPLQHISPNPNSVLQQINVGLHNWSYSDLRRCTEVEGDNRIIFSSTRIAYAKNAVRHRIAAHNDQTGYDSTNMASPAKTSRVGAKVQPTRKPKANTYRDR